MSQNQAGCLGFLFRLFKRQDTTPAKLPLNYRLQNHFLSKAELAFHATLKEAVQSQAIICPKVRLADIFFVPGKSYAQYNRIAQKHVDFLLCDPATMRPLVGVELDDRSHDLPERQARDQFVDEVFQAANLPIIHFPARSSYSSAEIKATLQPCLEATETIPACPKCGMPMVKRTAKTGTNAGKQFYGCRNYPNCREMLPL